MVRSVPSGAVRCSPPRAFSACTSSLRWGDTVWVTVRGGLSPMAVTTGEREFARDRAARMTSAWSTARIFAFALALQLFHLLEHVVQVAQAKFLNIKPAHGILGSFFDLEWVHFVYNWGLFVLLVVATIAVIRDRQLRAPIGWLF